MAEQSGNQGTDRRAASQDNREQKVNAEIDSWFDDSFRGTSLGNDTDTWNLVHGAKEELKRRLSRV